MPGAISSGQHRYISAFMRLYAKTVYVYNIVVIIIYYINRAQNDRLK